VKPRIDTVVERTVISNKVNTVARNNKVFKVVVAQSQSQQCIGRLDVVQVLLVSLSITIMVLP
jgi:hypothetical protein